MPAIKPAVEDWRRAAQSILPRFAWAYLEGGAEDWRTAAQNVVAFERVGFEPRVLVDVSHVDTSTELFGERLAFPAAVGPTGLNGIFRFRADEQLAAAAGRAGVPFVLSTASTSFVEDVRARATGPLWLQMYVQHDRRIAERWMRKARDYGFSVLMLTVDTPVAGIRNHYQRTGFTLPLRWTPRLLADIVTHPRWCLGTGIHGMPQMVNLAASSEAETDIDVQAATMNQQMAMNLTWDDLRWVRRHWDGPVLVKGIGSLSDAKLARNHGADGIVLSNHGGRQLEDAPLALDLLPSVVDAVGAQMKVLVDGGVRRGSSIAKAIAIGASAVLLGRTPLYGVAAAGEAGAADVLAILKSEVEITLRLLGSPRVSGLDRSFVRFGA
jgi:(S)-mandelate dehydrogenase